MRKIILLLLVAVVAFNQLSAQQKTITGKVTDPKGEVMSNVSGVIKGTKEGITIKQDGSIKRD